MVSAQSEPTQNITAFSKMEKEKVRPASGTLHKAIDELIKTEENYVKDLDDICNVYIPCFKFNSAVSADDVATIFSNLHDLLSLHQDLLKDFTSSQGDLQCIAKCFIDRAPEFTVYSSYCTRYHRANERLFELKHQTAELSAMLIEVQATLGHPLPLSSYLHKPVQRILKYHLILKNFMALCDNEDLVPLVGEAYNSMAECAQQINNCKRLTEMDLQTRELHELILTIRESDHLGKLIREGEMTLKQGRTSSEVFLYLFENVLVICHKPKEVFSLHSVMRCSELLILENSSRRELEFSLVPFSAPSHALTLLAKNLTQKLDWCIQLHKLTSHNIPNKARRLLLNHAKDSNQELDQTFFHKTPSPKRPTLNLLSPRFLGKRIRKQFGTLTLDLKERSKSYASLASISGSTYELNRLSQTSTPSSDTISFKSHCSGSSDLGSSIITESDLLQSPSSVLSYDDSCERFKQLGEDIRNHSLESWHYLLKSRIQQFHDHEMSDVPTKLTRSQSCCQLSTPQQHQSHVQLRKMSKNKSLSAVKKSRRRSFLDMPSIIYRAWQGRKKQEMANQTQSYIDSRITHACRAQVVKTPKQVTVVEPNNNTSSNQSDDNVSSISHTKTDSIDCLSYLDEFKIDLGDDFSDSLLNFLNSVLRCNS